MRRLRNFQPPRRGYLMIDLIIVLFLTIFVLSMSSIWVYKSMLYSAEVGQRDLHVRNISRISRQMRNDARGARKLSVADGKLSILTTDSLSIEYSIESNQVHRRAGIHNEKFPFARNAVLQWNVNPKEKSVSLEILRDVSRFSASGSPQRTGLDVQIRISAVSEVSQ